MIKIGLILALVTCSTIKSVEGFHISARLTSIRKIHSGSTRLFSVESPSDVDIVGDAAGSSSASGAAKEEDIRREKLKRDLLIASASYDRGYGSTPSSQKIVDEIIDKLELLNPTADASTGIDEADNCKSPLEGIWQMVWTTAQDVLLLNASPFTTVGAIYQVIEPPVATNIIDLLPRGQALLPPGVMPSLLRAEVTTKVSKRANNMPLRVGLLFESVKLRPMQVLGTDVDSVLPPFQVNFPSLENIVDFIPGSDPDNRPGYFDVVYLDDQMLIIRQNTPGGVFALVKSDSYDP